VNLKPFISSIPDWCIKFVDVPGGLKTGWNWQISFEVAKKDHPVKVTLVWTDYPALPDKYPSLVNNLDLIISDPDGKDYHGNVFSPHYDGKRDAINSVKSVPIPDSRPGKYRITVLATEVLQGPQEFSLVNSGGFSYQKGEKHDIM
jgi:hypothetical protein